MIIKAKFNDLQDALNEMNFSFVHHTEVREILNQMKINPIQFTVS